MRRLHSNVSSDFTAQNTIYKLLLHNATDFYSPCGLSSFTTGCKKVMSPCIAFDSIIPSNTEPRTNPVNRTNKY